MSLQTLATSERYMSKGEGGKKMIMMSESDMIEAIQPHGGAKITDERGERGCYGEVERLIVIVI